jgi:hypothetical protein
MSPKKKTESQENNKLKDADDNIRQKLLPTKLLPFKNVLQQLRNAGLYSQNRKKKKSVNSLFLS